MKYTNKSYNVALGSGQYREGWERIFGKKAPAEIVVEMVDAFVNADAVVICMTCGGELPGDRWCHICGAYK